MIHDVWKGPRDLLKSLDRWLQGEAPQLKSPPAPNETLAERHQQIIARIDSAQAAVARAGGRDRRRAGKFRP
ncbi:hypothetical protein LNO78_21180 [Klebsiella pneumoniae subsp. pneumoniae]|nr:hypothetical protein [Klebsiella pneumoniae subsp. pneumoniae]